MPSDNNVAGHEVPFPLSSDLKSGGKSVKPYEGPSYTATRLSIDPNEVVVVANGINRSTGYFTALRVNPARIHPIMLDFINVPPSGIVIPVLVPFTERLVVNYPMGHKTIAVNDTEGRHDVEIMSEEHYRGVGARIP